MAEYEPMEFGHTIIVTGTPEELAVMKERQNRTFAAIRATLDAQMYASFPGFIYARKPTLKQKLQAFFERTHDAWVVLIGRADIGY